MFKRIYYDGCNGQQIGEVYDFEEAIQLLVSSSTEFFSWTEEEATQALQDAQKNNEPVNIDDEGMEQLIPV